MKPALKPRWRKVTVEIREDRLDLIDELLGTLHRSRNSWLAELVDHALPGLAREAEGKRRRLIGLTDSRSRPSRRRDRAR